jgi:hypothetical protein
MGAVPGFDRDWDTDYFPQWLELINNLGIQCILSRLVCADLSMIIQVWCADVLGEVELGKGI